MDATTVEEWARNVSRSSPSPGGSPRKIPECKYCGKPRKNHPRSGCPYVDPPIPASPSSGRRQDEQTRQLTNSMQSLRINNTPPKAPGRRISGTPRELVVEASVELAFAPDMPSREDHSGTIKASSPSPGDGRSGGDTRPATPVPEILPSLSQRSTLSRSVSQNEHELFFQSLLKNPGAVIVKHSRSDMPAFLAFLKRAGYTATVISSVDDAELVAIGKDAQLVRQVGRIGRTQSEVVDEACDKQAAKGGFPALVACTGAGVAMGAVATWTGLAFA